MTDDLAQPQCPDCHVVMHDHPRGFRCPECGRLDDHAAELEAIVVPPGFDGPAIRGG